MLALAAAAWLVYTQVWGTGGTHPLAWTDLTSRVRGLQLVHREVVVIQSRRTFVKVVRAAMPGRAPGVPPLDWQRREVVMLAVGPRSGTGYSVEVQRVVEHRRSIDVYARERTPSLGDPVTAEVTYPYRVIAIHHSHKPVYVKLQGR
ncbi:MAG TPA: protease complex subunit PrcB family protein [Candidatus Acidoferrum sp.]|nr:protease complex subunit PrcB family protein [Candidatus Acidoferrum sp.]